MLSDQDIIKAIRLNELELTPFRKELLQPASIDLILSCNFASFDPNEQGTPLDPANSSKTIKMNKFTIKNNSSYELASNEFMLASTEEIIKLNKKISARFEGKSTLARCGLLTHVTAGFIDPGFNGRLTLELYNLSQRSIILRPGMPIGQLSFFYLKSECIHEYGSNKLNSKYQNQDDAQPAKPMKIFNHNSETF